MSRARVVVSWFLRLGLGAVFVAAGLAKLRDPAGFADEIANYRLLPSLAPLLAITLPAVELVVGVAIVVGPAAWRRAAAVASAALLAVFTVAVAQVVARGIDVDCGCFGVGTGPVTPWTIGRDVVLLAAAVALLASIPPERARG